MSLGRRAFLATGAAAAVALGQRRQIPMRPNVLVVMTEGLAAWMLGCYGNKELKTPHIDTLARSGIRMGNSFVSTPVSAPSRATFFTGLVPRQHGIQDGLTGQDPSPQQKRLPATSVDAVLVSDLLGRAGYQCGYIGTWGMGDPQKPGHGFSHTYTVASTEQGSMNPLIYRNGEGVQEKGYAAPLFTAEADRFIRAQTADKPWFLTVSYPNVHPPQSAYPPDHSKSFAQVAFETIGWEPAAPNALGGKELLSEAVASIRKSAASIAALDDQIAKISVSLIQANMRDNTLVLFTSDNGHLLGRHGLWGNGLASKPVNMYDEVMHVPMLLAWPGQIPPEAVAPELVSFYDVVPTIAEITGLTVPASHKLCGRSFAPAVFREPFPSKQPWENLVFGHYRDTEMARDKRFKLVLRAGGMNELYDLTTDPVEKRNEYDNPSYTTVRKRLTAELTDWRKKTS